MADSGEEHFEEHFWAPHEAQKKHEAMYHLRKLIRDPDVSVNQGLISVKCTLGEGLESLLDEALQSKCPEDGQNLLMYAAARGNEAWFLGLADEMRSRLGIHTLVKELRETDIDGAPLLFHAASSRREHCCFRTTHDLVYMVLGKGGLMDQVEALDGLGRGMLMHAARSNHVDTFNEVICMCKEAETFASHGAHLEPEARAREDDGLLRSMFGKKDHLDMTCLHHAAEAGSSAVLRVVMTPYTKATCPKEERCQSLMEPDKRCRTPIMLVLRNAYCCEGEEHTCGENDLEDKFNMLYQAVGSIGWMKPSPVRRPRENATDTKEEIEAVTELIHAARGGLKSLELALNHALPASKSKKNDQDKLYVDLDKALKIEFSNNDSGGRRETSSPSTWGRAMLLAAAAKLGDLDVLLHVLKAIENGEFVLQGDQGTMKLAENTQPYFGENVKKVLSAIDDHGASVFSYAILSGRKEAVELIYDVVVEVFEDGKETVWSILTGKNSISSLTCAASASMESDGYGLTMFDVVFGLLKKQAKWRRDEQSLSVRDLLSPRPPLPPDDVKISPLAGAAFSSNWVLFREVYTSYMKLAKEKCWCRQNVLLQIPPVLPHRRSVLEFQELHERQDVMPPPKTCGTWTIPAVMWPDLVKAYTQARPARNHDPRGDGTRTESPLSWREDFKVYSRRGVKVAAARGNFTALRDLVKEGFPLHDHHIPALLENIGDHEQDVIDTVLAAVANASNPLAMGAGVSRTLRASEVDHPMNSKALRRLQNIMDNFSNEMLDKLPQSVRGVGVALLGGHQPVTFGEGLQQGIHHRLANLAGFIVVQWMLEPNLLVREMNSWKKYTGPDYIDPLRRALDRSSESLELLNSPLVLDYVHVKFAGTLPSWTSRNPFQPTVNEGFYKYQNFDGYKLSEILFSPVQSYAQEGDPIQNEAVKELFLSKSFLLRFLQGWDHSDPDLKWNIPLGQRLVNKDGGTTRCTSSIIPSWCRKPKQWRIPHSTLLPGLQFSLAGILGKPETFYQVPVIRFVFEIFMYIGMLVLFGTSVLLKKHDFVPGDEIAFYVFAAGLLCREIREFRDGMPARRHPPYQRARKFGTGTNNMSYPQISIRDSGDRWNGMASAFTRYVFYDSWNFLDTSTICCILIAFIFRMKALDNVKFFFLAQFFYALSAPLLFSRLLVLSQIDSTLGPMTQVIWRMMSDTLRFSAFIAVVLLSFALAFHAMFHTCGKHEDPNCDLEDDDDFPLQDAFGTFGRSFVTVFKSALGGPDFEVFEDVDNECRCDLPAGARQAGVFLMVVYMVTMAVVLLNLLIAVLSTAHHEVYVNAKKEFHLARAKLIYQSARDVTHRRPPPPLNLAKIVFGFLLDFGMELVRLYRCCYAIKPRSPWRPSSNPPPPATVAPTSDGEVHVWRTFDGFLQRLAFAFTLGVAVIFVSAILWMLSVPWMGWCLLRSVRPAEDAETNARGFEGTINQEDKEEEEDNEKVRPGYIRGILSTIFSVVVLLLAMALASVLCVLYVLGTIVLWFVGICMIWKWAGKNWNKQQDNIPIAMPGQEDGDHWKNAWELARRRNYGVREGCDQAHFNVIPFIKSKTGLDMRHLARLTKARDEKSKSEEELVDVDRKLPCARVDLSHLVENVRRRAEMKRTTVTPVGRVVVGSVTDAEGKSPEDIDRVEEK